MAAQLDLRQRGFTKNVVTLGMRCCCLPWVGLAGGSRRTLRISSPRILCRCPVLRRQILGVCSRDLGADSRGHRSRNRSCPALPQGHPCPHRAGRAVDGAVTRPHLSSSETISRCRRGHVYHPAKCYDAIRPWEIPRPECTTRSKRLQKQGGEDASVHHVCIVFPFRREGTCQ